MIQISNTKHNSYPNNKHFLIIIIIIRKQHHLHLLLLLHVLDLVVPRKLMVSLVEIGIFSDLRYDLMNFLLRVFRFDISGIIAKIKESRCLLSMGSL